MKITQAQPITLFSIGNNYVLQTLWKQYTQGLHFPLNQPAFSRWCNGNSILHWLHFQNASQDSPDAAGQQPFVIILQSSFSCLHFKNNKRKHERVKANSLGSIPFVKWTKKSLEGKSHFSVRGRPWHQNMFLLSALLNILIGVILSSACRNAQGKSYWLCDFEEGWGDSALLCILYVNQPRIYTEEAMGLINLYSQTIKQSCIFKSL